MTFTELFAIGVASLSDPELLYPQPKPFKHCELPYPPEKFETATLEKSAKFLQAQARKAFEQLKSEATGH